MDYQQIMKTRILPIALFCFSVALLSGPPSVWASEAAATKQARIYDESANGDNQVADAVAIAEKEHKRILLKFGANWCSWCHKLHKLFESDKSVSEELRADYVVALIDVNKGHNKDLVVKYGAQAGYGIPFLVVLDSDGTHLITKHCEEFEEGGHYNPQKVLAFLKESALKR